MTTYSDKQAAILKAFWAAKRVVKKARKKGDFAPDIHLRRLAAFEQTLINAGYEISPVRTTSVTRI